ncbi:MAG TPA: nitroreductase family protein [Pseudomonadales bacterium]|jgi:nitroreductase
MARGYPKIDLPVGCEPTDNIWEAMFTQRAIRYWQDKPVPRELLEKVVAAGSKAPSGSNTQPWVFVVVDEPDKRAELGAALRGIFDAAEPLQQLISAGEQSDDKTERLMLKGARAFFSHLEKAPAMIIPCLYGLSSPTQDATSLLAGSSIYLAVQNVLLAARALGLGTVMTTVHGMLDADLRRILSLPEDATPVALLPIGYPDANFGPTTRKGLDEILRWNGW